MIDVKINIKELQSVSVDKKVLTVQALAPRTKLLLSKFVKENYWFDLTIPVNLHPARAVLNNQRCGNIQNNHSIWADFRVIKQ